MTKSATLDKYRVDVPIDEFIENHKGLVFMIANRYRSLLKRLGVEMQDLEQIGTIGLLKARKEFDPTRNIAFSTYASVKIEGEIRRYHRDHNPIIHYPRSIKEIAFLIYKNQWYDKNISELKDLLPEKLDNVYITEERIQGALSSMRNGKFRSSADTAYNSEDGEDITYEQQVGTEQDYSSVFVKDFISMLPDILKTVLVKRMEGISQQEIADDIGKSQTQVSRYLRRIPKLYAQYQKGLEVEKKIT